MTTIRATIIQTPVRGEFELLEDHVVTIDESGVISSVLPAGADTSADVALGPDTVLLPGLIDTHIHAPQWPQLATGLDVPLEQWLFDDTFPLEARYADSEFAERVWDAMVPRLLSSGTTSAVYYSSIHEDATLSLAAACLEFGQRAFVGRVAMDHPEGTPEWYRDEDAGEGVSASHRSIASIEGLAGVGGLVQPIITPRFIPACSDSLLTGLGELAHATGVRTQTHCSESDWEHRYVLDRYSMTDTAALVDFGLARNNSVLAHACHLTDDDVDKLVHVGAGVAHCPLSNSYFGNGVLPVAGHLDRGLRVGLGTDVAGGPEGAVLKQCASAVTSSRMLEDGVDTRLAQHDRGVASSRISIFTAFWLATVGGAELLDIPAGLISPGRHFDAIAINIEPGNGLGIWPEVDDWARVFEKIVRGATPTEITNVWVGGREVVGYR